MMQVVRIDTLKYTGWLPPGERVVSMATYRDFVLVITDSGSLYKLTLDCMERI